MTSFGLHILAMVLMLGDHLWATIFPYYEWLTCLGRIAFPIFAFMSVEGYFYTHNFKKYLLRLTIFALLSEIPFNLMMNSSYVYPWHQNVIWTFIIGLLLIRMVDYGKSKGKVQYALFTVLALVLAEVLGLLTFVDYYQYGIFTMLLFYYFHGDKWYHKAGQLIGLIYLFQFCFKGYYYDIPIGNETFELQQEAFAVLSLIPIWTYKGKQGYHAKWFQYFCYAFYPTHLLIVYLIWQLVM